MCIIHGHILYFWCPYGKMLDKGKILYKLFFHMAGNLTWPPNAVNFVAIWKVAYPDPNNII